MDRTGLEPDLIEKYFNRILIELLEIKEIMQKEKTICCPQLQHRNIISQSVDRTGLEPATPSLQMRCSTR